jgi:hypothetical protein
MMIEVNFDDRGLSMRIELGEEKRRFDEQLKRLAEHKVTLTDAAKAYLFLAIASIADEPHRAWPQRLTEDSAERRALQISCIDGLAAHFFPLGYRFERERHSGDIAIFDAIQHTGDLLGLCRNSAREATADPTRSVTVAPARGNQRNC